ncbi:MAG TPA: glucuronate isomerase, partial [Phaeodactylibacter sp.]|nr:glucuronate isomerase [Phaeodactylibacter sp.]
KIQWGSAWWLLGQKNGVEQQLNMLSDTGLLSHFIGIASESGSLLSFSRHEYFRRILCNLIGQDVAKGLLPDDMKLLGKLVQQVSYSNAEKYFDV